MLSYSTFLTVKKSIEMADLLTKYLIGPCVKILFMAEAPESECEQRGHKAIVSFKPFGGSVQFKSVLAESLRAL